MAHPKRSDLLNFLSEPRCLKEVAEHFGISASVADHSLQKAIEQNQVLICKPLRKPSLKSQKQRDTLFYISQDSDLFSRGLTGFAVTRGIRTQGEVGSRTAFVKFSSKNASKSNFSSITENASDHKNDELGGAPFPRITVRREKIVRNARRHASAIGQPPTQRQIRSCSVAEKLSMLTALSRQPLPYSDLRTRFNIPKSTIRTFVKNGLVKEVWGSKNIGVRFRLTKKGEKRLERLKAAAKLEKDEIAKATIRLKYKSI